MRESLAVGVPIDAYGTPGDTERTCGTRFGELARRILRD